MYFICCITAVTFCLSLAAGEIENILSFIQLHVACEKISAQAPAKKALLYEGDALAELKKKMQDALAKIKTGSSEGLALVHNFPVEDEDSLILLVSGSKYHPLYRRYSSLPRDPDLYRKVQDQNTIREAWKSVEDLFQIVVQKQKDIPRLPPIDAQKRNKLEDDTLYLTSSTWEAIKDKKSLQQVTEYILNQLGLNFTFTEWQEIVSKKDTYYVNDKVEIETIQEDIIEAFWKKINESA